MKVRIRPLTFFLILILLCMWIFYPMLRDNVILTNDDIVTEYVYSDGMLVESTESTE